VASFEYIGTLRKKSVLYKEEMTMVKTKMNFVTNCAKAEKFKKVFRLFGVPYYSVEYYERIMFIFDFDDSLREKVDALIDLSFGEEDYDA
jgi:hypothetical protein